ncbi:hypothetical protein ASPSYDRAFT_1079643 [Aspergillus sydowii CBS 593.65]|uniref:Uncharacterized protein n=1 Tax=Aspergillus sydowii CBS 593.65 TaxID=1036612 RepID=A0A1L9TE75_9EURO|nr:uncharacterized protein ASPSYDRAFT_1079643 [Aspergillus sydowii CBS 593.65]OJJ57722.1 hypothetical protein ASPSYDRAFT_1079643 [Aspergillus sydowii CBS 593.65]
MKVRDHFPSMSACSLPRSSRTSWRRTSDREHATCGKSLVPLVCIAERTYCKSCNSTSFASRLSLDDRVTPMNDIFFSAELALKTCEPSYGELAIMCDPCQSTATPKLQGGPLPFPVTVHPPCWIESWHGRPSYRINDQGGLNRGTWCVKSTVNQPQGHKRKTKKTSSYRRSICGCSGPWDNKKLEERACVENFPASPPVRQAWIVDFSCWRSRRGWELYPQLQIIVTACICRQL